MKINRRSWHAKVFTWWYGVKHGTNEWAVQNTNLCPYVRAVLFWAPVRFFLDPTSSHFAKFFWGVLLASIEGLLLHFGGWKVFLAELKVLGLIALCVGVVLSIFGTVAAVKRVKRTEVIQSFTEVLVERYKASHDKICPIVELV